MPWALIPVAEFLGCMTGVQSHPSCKGTSRLGTILSMAGYSLPRTTMDTVAAGMVVKSPHTQVRDRENVVGTPQKAGGPG